MALPLGYSLRNMIVRKSSSFLTALGIAMTVAVFAGIFALREGFEQIYRPRGREDLAVYLRPGATSEGESGLVRETVDILIKSRPEIARNAQDRPLAAAETYLAVFLEKVAGGITNVPIRGIQPMSLELQGERLRLVEGRWLNFGSDEVVVGRPLTRRIRGMSVGDTLRLNVKPFTIVGVYETEGALGSEIWGDVDRVMAALQRPFFQRVIARVAPGSDLEKIAAELKSDPRTPVQFSSERVYLSRQTGYLGGTLAGLGILLTLIMGVAAVLGAVNTMLAAVTARTHEIGVLLSIGFRRWMIFAAFVLESAAIGFVGGLLGLLLILPFHGFETGAVNWNTFTDVSFAFRLTPALMLRAVAIGVLLGMVGGALPARYAARLKPVDALRQQ